MVNGIGIGTKSGRHGMSIFNVKDTKKPYPDMLLTNTTAFSYIALMIYE